MTRSFFKTIHSQPAATPIRTRQPTATHRAFTAPGRPVVLMKGEKAKEVRAGVKVLMMTEQMPNTPPRMPPARGPKRMAPRITGMWTVVALVMTSGIMPRGVLASSTTMAAIMATPAIHLASFLRFFIFNYLLLSLLS